MYEHSTDDDERRYKTESKKNNEFKSCSWVVCVGAYGCSTLLVCVCSTSPSKLLLMVLTLLAHLMSGACC